MVNLEEILKKELIPTVFAGSSEMTFNATLRAMKEACRQVLELAAENAKTSHDYYDKWDENEAYNKHKDFGFERCDGDGIPYGVDVITINKQSIIDTINLVY